MHGAFGAGDGPVAYLVLAAAFVGLPAALCQSFGRQIRRFYFGIFVVIRYAPCRSAVAYESVGQKDDRSHVLQGDACRLESHGEAVGGRNGCNYGHGRFAVASVEGLHQVGLLGLGGEAG